MSKELRLGETVSKHKKRQVEKIIAATLNVVQRDGFSQLNVSSIAEEAGLTRQTIYNHFPDVESIVSEAIDQHIQAMETHLLDAINSVAGFENKLLAVAELLFAVASSDHRQVSLEMGLSGEQRQRLTEQTNTIKSALLTPLNEILSEQSANPPQNPRALIDILWGMIEGAAEASRDHPADKDDLLSFVNQVLNAALTNYNKQ